MSCEIPKNGMIGKSVPVRDAAMKVTGQMRYVADMKLPGMLYAKILFSPVPHARIKSIDTTQAQALEGVHAVVCYKDSPKNRYNGNGEDKDINPPSWCLTRLVRFVGDMWRLWRPTQRRLQEKPFPLISVNMRASLLSDPRKP